MGDGIVRVRDADGIEEALVEFVSRNVAAGGERVAPQENLIDSGKVDSLGLLQILSFVDEQWHVDLLVLGGPRDLQSVAGLAGAVRRELAARQRPAAEGA